ncbi:glycosyltransferase family 39 protein [Brevundimonas sp. 2R-24]|uniref:Glycosyltransferase family 39 protein n=1 Tax=Peiella sedimenti TaxID=3061083 RepID=A0ABT8SLN5_9CAUL|nr:glycosyltransferase family 39 protein [Caulobacteraceae bacterium XZ-24]
MPPERTDAAPMSDPLRWGALLILGLTAVRLVALFLSPLELYPDEAQYWLWSRDLAFGYFSKPPMIAWLIALTTAIAGDSEAGVRLFAPLLHAGTAFVLMAVALRLSDRITAFWAALIYSLMPGVQLSAGLASTDAALLFFLSLALLAYVELDRRQGREALVAAAGLGAALGLAFLSKYAAIYFLIGAALHAVLSHGGRARWSWARGSVAAGALAVFIAPNLLWNAANDFATVSHTAANANLGADLFHPAQAAEFVASQLGVFGPVPFVLLIWAMVRAFRRRSEPEIMLAALTIPPLLIVTVEAFLSRANANWAAAAYVPGSVLAALMLVSLARARRWWQGGVALPQGALAAVFLVAAISPAAADALGLSNSFKRARGWEAASRLIMDEARDQGVATIATDDRFLFNSLAFYERERLALPGAPVLRMWVRTGRAATEAERAAPLDAGAPGPVLLASLEGKYAPEMQRDFASTVAPSTARVRLDRKRVRRVEMMIAQGFRPGPRDAEGKPIPQAAP